MHKKCLIISLVAKAKAMAEGKLIGRVTIDGEPASATLCYKDKQDKKMLLRTGFAC